MRSLRHFSTIFYSVYPQIQKQISFGVLRDTDQSFSEIDELINEALDSLVYNLCEELTS